jgi:3',5'-cyclic-AMP phosphodiesterase
LGEVRRRLEHGRQAGDAARARMHRIAIGLTVLLASACLEYTPHALPTAGEERDRHAKALAALAPDTGRGLVIAALGDTQTHYDETEDAIDALNARGDVDLVVQLGDLTDLGTLHEFRTMRTLLDRLHAPWLVVVGNHDLLGNGRRIYEHMFGERNLAFTWERTRLVLFDSNSREYGTDGSVPDLGWLAAQLDPSPDHDRVVIFSHVPPTTDDFDPALAGPYLEAVRTAAPSLSLHAHLHRLEQHELDGVRVVVADKVDGRTYLLVRLPPGGGIELEVVPF